MSSDSLMRAVTGQNPGSPFWMILFFYGLYFFAPVLLGVAALHARLVPQQQALYPILSVLLLVIAGLLPTGSAGPWLPIIFHGVAWTGFGVLALTVKPGMTPALQPATTRKGFSRELK